MTSTTTAARSKPAADVIVVGAGPAGLLLAGLLAQASVQVVVLETQRQPSRQSRASTLHARAMEILHDNQVPGLTTLTRVPSGHYAGLPLDLTVVESQWCGQWKLPQPDLVALLATWARTSGATIVDSAHVDYVEQRRDQVRAGTSDGRIFTALWLIGADGAGSLVRRLARIGVSGAVGHRRLVRADVAGQPLRGRRFERVGELTLTAAPVSDHLTRVMAHDPSWGVSYTCSAANLRRLWKSATGEDITGPITWIDHFDDSGGVADHFRRGRVVLCGDAAHYGLPVGGDSLNGAILDAHNLAWKLALAVTTGGTGLMNTYASERRAAAWTSNAWVRGQARLLFSTDSTASRDKAALRDRLLTDRAFHDWTATTVAGVDAHYPAEQCPVMPRPAAAQLSALDIPRRRHRPLEALIPIDFVTPNTSGPPRRLAGPWAGSGLVRPDDHWMVLPADPDRSNALRQAWLADPIVQAVTA